MSDLSQELRVATRLAHDAARVILEVYARPFEVVEKAAGAGPVTEADTRANELIVTGLREAFPDDEIVAEESPSQRPTARRVWFVDPLDGTREFVDRNGMFAVHVGLAIDGEAVAGVVHAPVSGQTWAGARGHPCTWTQGDETRTLMLPECPEPSALRLLVSRSHKSKKTALIQQALGITSVREHGSVGFKVGLLALGEADLYLHPSPRASRWDSCAPQAVLEAAGGVLVDFAGNPYRYDGSELENRRGLVGCSRETLARVGHVIERVARETGLLG
jgi:3'(2'), 5'-bisphosphate nucleotidase